MLAIARSFNYGTHYPGGKIDIVDFSLDVKHCYCYVWRASAMMTYVPTVPVLAPGLVQRAAY